MMPANDTSIKAARIQRHVLVGKTADERAQMAFEMSGLVRQLVMDGIHRRHPGLSADEFTLLLIERLHGRELATAVAASNVYAMEAELLRTVVAALESAGILHMVTGSMASAIHGQPRATRAIDLAGLLSTIDR